MNHAATLAARTVAVLLGLATVCFAQTPEKHPYDVAREQFDKTVAAWKTQYADNPDVLVADYVLADRKAKKVTVLACATTASLTDPVEFFVTPTNSGKDYESLTLTFAKPSDIHKALVFIGLTPGRPVNYETNHQWPRGPRVIMTLEIDGKPVRAEDLIYQTEKQTTLPRTGLVFAGSYTTKDDAGNPVYAADAAEARTIAPNFNDPVAVLDIPTRAAQGQVYGFQRPNPKIPLKPGQLTPITLAPGEGPDAVVSRDLRIHTNYIHGEARYALHEGDKPLAPAGTLPALVESIATLADGRTDLFTTAVINPAMPVTDVRKLYGVLMAVEKDRGLKLDPPPAGDFYHRAFFPDDTWRVREDRLGEPWELFLTRSISSGFLTGKLERLVDNPDPNADAKQLLESVPVTDPEALLKHVNDNQSQWTKAIFVYPPSDLTYAEAQTWLKPTLPTYPRVFFFPPAAPTTQPVK